MGTVVVTRAVMQFHCQEQNCHFMFWVVICLYDFDYISKLEGIKGEITVVSSQLIVVGSTEHFVFNIDCFCVFLIGLQFKKKKKIVEIAQCYIIWGSHHHFSWTLY